MLDKIKDIEDQIDMIMKKYQKEYEELGKISEKLYDQRESLDKEYKKLEDSYKQLDKKTGLNKLFEELGKLKNKKD